MEHYYSVTANALPPNESIEPTGSSEMGKVFVLTCERLFIHVPVYFIDQKSQHDIIAV